MRDYNAHTQKWNADLAWIIPSVPYDYGSLLSRKGNAMIELDETLKDFASEAGRNSLLNLVRDHKQTCNRSDCGISLYLIRRFLYRNGIKLSEQEEELFLWNTARAAIFFPCWERFFSCSYSLFHSSNWFPDRRTLWADGFWQSIAKDFAWL